jgi:TolB-like protein
MAGLTRLHRWFAIGALTLVIGLAALAIGLGQWWNPGLPATAATQTEADALAATLDRVLQRAPGARSGIAIRPLASASSPAGAPSIADGVCETLGAPLARLPDMRLVPCSATQAAVAANLDDRSLASLLGVRYVLSGSLQPMAGERLRVKLQMRDVVQSRAAWQIDEDMPDTDLRQLPLRVADETRRLLGHPHVPSNDRPLGAEAYRKFVRAAELAPRPSMEGRREALRLIEEVIAAEPDQLRPQLLRVQLLDALAGNLGGPNAREDAAQMLADKEARRREYLRIAQRMVDADPSDLRAHVLLLNNDLQTRQLVNAFQRMDDVLQRAASSPHILRIAAGHHLYAGYLDRAGQLALAAVRQNALDAEALELLTLVRGMQGDDQAFRELLALTRQVGHRSMGFAAAFEAFRRQDWATLEREHTAYIGQGGKWSADWVATFARALADAQLRPQMLEWFDSQDSGTRHHFGHYFLEKALLGEHERSLRAIRHHAELGSGAWVRWLWWPELAAARRQAGFVEAMQRLGLTELWAVRGAPDLCRRAGDGLWSCR